MILTVQVYAELRPYLPDDWRDGPIALADDATVSDLLGQLGIPAEETGLVSLDGRIVSDEQALRGGSEVRIFAPAGGG
ncbi:MAG: MoaD/ThiS family protein [Chloroflexota bacterium]|nr:MoaD/ThiS family protein [Chloroflexota bacterium]